MNLPVTTPITVLTGFLGSGKTTLLNALLRDARLSDSAVIINEFGEVGLDHLLVKQAEENVVLLDSGCICCTIGNGLAETLETLYRQRLQGSIPAFQRVIVETTGLADPFSLLKTVLADYFVSKHFTINGVLTTVDSLHGLAQLEEHREARNQALVASHIVITKTDVAAVRDVEALKTVLGDLNSAATTSFSFQPGTNGMELGTEIVSFVTRPPGADFLLEPVSPAELFAKCDKDHFHDAQCTHSIPNPGEDIHASHFHHDERIKSFTFYWPNPVSWQEYAAWLEQLRRLPAGDLMRVKGLLELDRGKPPYVIQGVQHTFAAPVRLPETPTAGFRSWLVVIARGIRRDTLETIFLTHPTSSMAAHNHEH